MVILYVGVGGSSVPFIDTLKLMAAPLTTRLKAGSSWLELIPSYQLRNYPKSSSSLALVNTCILYFYNAFYAVHII